MFHSVRRTGQLGIEIFDDRTRQDTSWSSHPCGLTSPDLDPELVRSRGRSESSSTTKKPSTPQFSPSI